MASTKPPKTVIIHVRARTIVYHYTKETTFGHVRKMLKAESVSTGYFNLYGYSLPCQTDGCFLASFEHSGWKLYFVNNPTPSVEGTRALLCLLARLGANMPIEMSLKNEPGEITNKIPFGYTYLAATDIQKQKKCVISSHDRVVGARCFSSSGISQILPMTVVAGCTTKDELTLIFPQRFSGVFLYVLPRNKNTCMHCGLSVVTKDIYFFPCNVHWIHGDCMYEEVANAIDSGLKTLLPDNVSDCLYCAPLAQACVLPICGPWQRLEGSSSVATKPNEKTFDESLMSWLTTEGRKIEHHRDKHGRISKRGLPRIYEYVRKEGAVRGWITTSGSMNDMAELCLETKESPAYIDSKFAVGDKRVGQETFHDLYAGILSEASKLFTYFNIKTYKEPLLINVPIHSFLKRCADHPLLSQFYDLFVHDEQVSGVIFPENLLLDQETWLDGCLSHLTIWRDRWHGLSSEEKSQIPYKRGFWDSARIPILPIRLLHTSEFKFVNDHPTTWRFYLRALCCVWYKEDSLNYTTAVLPPAIGEKLPCSTFQLFKDPGPIYDFFHKKTDQEDSKLVPLIDAAQRDSLFGNELAAILTKEPKPAAFFCSTPNGHHPAILPAPSFHFDLQRDFSMDSSL